MLNMLRMESLSLSQNKNDILLTHALMRQAGGLTLVLCFVAIRQYAYRHNSRHEYGVS